MIYSFFDAIFSLGWWLIIIMVGIPGLVGLLYLAIYISDKVNEGKPGYHSVDPSKWPPPPC